MENKVKKIDLISNQSDFLQKILEEVIFKIEQKKIEILLQRINERVGRFDKIEDVPKENISVYSFEFETKVLTNCFWHEPTKEPLHLVTFYDNDFVNNDFKNPEITIKYT